jgi:hypothetical protein
MAWNGFASPISYQPGDWAGGAVIPGFAGGAGQAIEGFGETLIPWLADTTPPTLQNQAPAPGDISVPVDTNIVLELVDAAGINAASVILKVNGTAAWQADAQQPGFSVTKTPIAGGFRYTINPDADLPEAPITIAVYAADTLSNVLDTSYGWSTVPDESAPELVRLNPSIEEKDVQAGRGVRLGIIDDFGVVDASIQIWIRDVPAYYLGSFQSGFTGSIKAPNTENGFEFLIIPDEALRWSQNERISVRVVAKDAALNLLDATYFFTGELAPEQPFSVYRFIMQAVRDHDEQSPGLLSAICEAFDQVWSDAMFERTSELPDLLDPDRIPSRWLPWLKSQVGFTRDLSFEPTEEELRRVIKGGVELWNDKPAEEAVRDAIRLVTGNRFLIRDYFDLRFEVDKVRVLEELEDFDPNVLLFSPNAFLQVQQLRTCISSAVWPCTHEFWFTDPAIPNFTDPKQFTHLLIANHPVTGLTGIYQIDQLFVGEKRGYIDGTPGFPVQTATVGPAKLLNVPGDYTTEIRLVDPGVGDLAYRALASSFTVGQRVIGQDSGAIGEIVADALIGAGTGILTLRHLIGRFEPNESIIDTLTGAATVDAKLADTTYLGEQFRIVNRELLDFLVSQVRAFGERYDVIFVDFIDQFITPGDLELWDTSLSGVTVPEPGGELTLATAATAFTKTAVGAFWGDQVATWKTQGPAGTISELWFMAVDASNGYKVEIDFTAHTVKLFKVVAGAPTQLGATVTLGTVILPDLDLVVRADALKEGVGTRIRIKVEGDLQIDLLDSPAAFSAGKLGVSAAGTGPAKFKLVEVNTLPTEILRIGLTP